MARIADHCRPDGWRGKDNPHALVCDWPDSVCVQWGGDGVVVNRKEPAKSYNTAFFEAFPDGGGFIRGEGETVEAAERKAYDRYLREQACGHVWGRRGYLNGGGVCLKCKGFVAGAFAEIRQLDAWKHPLTKMENDLLKMYEDHPQRQRDQRALRMWRWLRLRKAVFGADETVVTLRDHVSLLFGAES